MVANTRERAEREEIQEEVRERRLSATTDRFTRSKLNPFAAADLDHKNYEYRWFIDDNMGRVRDAYNRDWDYVSPKEVKNYDATLFNTESDGRIRNLMGPSIYGYFMKKRKEYYKQDHEAVLARHRETTGSDSLLEAGGARRHRQF